MAESVWDRIEAKDLGRLRDKRLRSQVRNQLYAFSPFYRKALDDSGVHASGFSGVADLGQIPMVSRDQLGDAVDQFLLTPGDREIQEWGSGTQLLQVFYDKLLRGTEASEKELRGEYAPVHALETVGTTAEPLQMWITRRDLALMATQGRRLFEVARVPPGSTVVNLMYPGPTGGFWSFWLGGLAHSVRQLTPGPLDPAQGAALVGEAKAGCLISRAEDALSLLQAADDDSLSSLRTLLLAPEVVTPALMRRLYESAADDLRIIRTYGFAEARAVWAECVEGAGHPDCGYHLYPDLELFEVISTRTLEPVDPGEGGEVVFTGLDQRGTALARYRPGDVVLGGIHQGPCRYCGRLVERLVGPVIRSDTLLELEPEGRERQAIDAEVLNQVLAHPGVSRWQVEISKADGEEWAPDEIYVRFQPRGKADPAEIAVDLDLAFREELGFSPTQFVLSEPTESGIVDLRSQ